MLEVAPTATADEIKRAFRREIARYHPDKVHHLGREFQEIAAVKAAELTQAYTILTDGVLRADYDAQLKAAVTPTHGVAPSSPAAARPETTDRPAHRAAPEPPPAPAAAFSRERAGASDLVRKAAVVRFRQALNKEFGEGQETPVQGFDVACLPPKGGFFSRSLPVRILGRFVAQVDAAAVQESWAMASRMKRDEKSDLCVFVMGPAVAPAGELGRAIAEQRRKPMPAGGTLVMVPVNTRTWSAHIPHDAPPVVKALIARLQSG